MPKHCTTFIVDGYEVRATFAESRNTAVTGHLKQILLASFAGNTPAGGGILAAAPGGWYPKDGKCRAP